MALILAFDTATPHLAVVLAKEGKPLAQREDATPSLSHAERLNIFIAEVLEEAGFGLADLEAVAVGIGPGSYTGLRIGLSAAKGLCFALDKPLIGMGTLELLVAEATHMQQGFGPLDVLFPMVDARRMEVYTCAYGADGIPQGTTSPLILDDAWCEAKAETGKTHVFGDGADKAVELWQKWPGINFIPGIRPAVLGLVTCADRYFKEGRFSDLAYLVPAYGKPANVAQKRGRE